MAGPYFNICSARDVGLARFVVTRLGRPEWLDIPWVHGTASLDLARDIIEDASDFPPELMAEASLVSLALRIGAVNKVPDMFLSVSNYAFYPSVTRDHLTGLLVAKGFQTREFPTNERERIEREPSAKEARAMLFNSFFPLPSTPLAGELFWELAEDDPAHAASLFADSSSITSSVLSQGETDSEAIYRGAKRLAAHVPAAKAMSFLSACAKGGLGPRLLEELTTLVPAFSGDPLYMTTAVGRATYARCSPETRKKLLGRDAKLIDLGVADSDAEVRAFVGPRVTLPAHIETLSKDPDPKVRFALVTNGRVDAATLEHLASNEPMPDHVALAVARHPNTTPALMHRLGTHPRADVRSALASHPALAPETAKVLALDGSAIVRLVIVKRGDLSSEQRLAFKRDDASDVRAVAIAGDPHATHDELASVPDNVRIEARSVVARASKDPGLLVAFATDTAENVRVAVGLNAHTPLDVLERLSRDKNGYVRGAVAGNSAASAEILGRLAVDEVHQIRQMAAASLGKLRKAGGAAAEDGEIPPEIEEVLVDPMAPPRRELARQRDLGRAVLEALSDDADSKVRSLLVRSKATPADLLDRLACDAEADVRGSVAATPRASERALSLLVDDERFAVRAVARERWAKLQTASKRKAKK